MQFKILVTRCSEMCENNRMCPEFGNIKLIPKPVNQSLLQLFIANFNTSTIVKNVLEKPIQARYIRINPIGHRRHLSMRIEIIGCDVPSSNSTSINVSNTLVLRIIHKTSGFDQLAIN